jgi:L-lactate dehydrogenase complex protein LldE
MRRTAQLFITCIVDSLYPEVGEAVVRVLNRAGARVEVPPGQTCCGQPAFNAGMRDQARRMAMHTIAALEPASGDIVVPSGSCAAMIRHAYAEMFAGDEEWLRRAQELSNRTYEFSEYLVDVLGVSDLQARFAGRLTYHSSCHLLRDLGVNHQPRSLLAQVRDCELVELPHADECCGFGGLFSVEHPEISTAMLQRKMANIASTGAQAVVSCDGGCIANINGGFHRRGKPPLARHLAEILDSHG